MVQEAIFGTSFESGKNGAAKGEGWSPSFICLRKTVCPNCPYDCYAMGNLSFTYTHVPFLGKYIPMTSVLILKMSTSLCFHSISSKMETFVTFFSIPLDSKAY